MSGRLFVAPARQIAGSSVPLTFRVTLPIDKSAACIRGYEEKELINSDAALP